MAKRSPILGYNHNVRYRGLVFHVQTEDSGIMSPHLFTHLFHTGVIVSTRKLVYDSGSAEDSIKSLMQAQHKAVLKDLRRGVFDDKIDEYLGSTPGLLPRGVTEAATEATEADDPSLPRLARPSAQIATEPTPKFDPDLLEDSGKTRRDDNRRDPTLPDVRLGLAAARTQTAERRSPTGQRAISQLDADPVDGPGAADDVGAVAAAISAANNATIRTSMPVDMQDSTPLPREFADSQPEIEIQLELDDSEYSDDLDDIEMPSPRTRSARDTDLAVPGRALDDHTRPTIDVSNLSDGVPSLTGAGATIRQGDSIPHPGHPVAPPTEVRRAPSAGVGAASLPPARPISRPPSRPAMSPPQVVSRPVTSDGERTRADSDAIEVYAPAPPSADTPPGLREAERPGQYAQHRKTQRVPSELPPRERSQGVPPIPPGLGRPGRASAVPPSPPERPPVVPAPRPRELGTQPLPRTTEAPPNTPRPRTLTPTRASGPAPARTGSPSSGGVVMTRPAVIVGAPAKSSPSRVRKAREDEGRGFGQGLISEKSLDEVILAYLSEDADDK